jgi:hypothetical protein
MVCVVFTSNASEALKQPSLERVLGEEARLRN